MFDKLKDKKQREYATQIGNTLNALHSGVHFPALFIDVTKRTIEHHLKKGELTKADADALLTVLNTWGPKASKLANDNRRIPWCATEVAEVTDWTQREVVTIARAAADLFDAFLADLTKVSSSVEKSHACHPSKLAAMKLNPPTWDDLKGLLAGKTPQSRDGSRMPDPSLFT